MKLREVILSPQARSDLLGIYDQIAAAGHPVNALRFVDRLTAFCRRMDVASERGHRRFDILPGLRIVGFEKSVTVAFMLDSDRVTILRLFYGGRDWAKALQ